MFISNHPIDTDLDTLKKHQISTLEGTGKEHEIILYNDDVNTFDHVIGVLVRVCKHTSEQAEQCALIVHLKGKCSVNHGSFNMLKPRHEALIDSGLSAEIQ